MYNYIFTLIICEQKDKYIMLVLANYFNSDWKKSTMLINRIANYCSR